MIEQVIVTDKDSANAITSEQKLAGKNVIRICISDNQASGLFKGGGKDKLVLHFRDIEVKAADSIRKNHIRKIKNFIFNNHVNNSTKFVLVVNCRAGQSRSTAIGRFCETLGMPVRYTQLEAKMFIFPNKLILRMLGVRSYDQDEYHPEFGFEDYADYRGFI